MSIESTKGLRMGGREEGWGLRGERKIREKNEVPNTAATGFLSQLSLFHSWVPFHPTLQPIFDVQVDAPSAFLLEFLVHC